MNRSSRRGLLAAALTAGVVVVGAAASGSAAAEQTQARGSGSIVEMKMVNHKPKFVADGAVLVGAELTIINKTKPNRIGPHTFTLIKESLLPEGKQNRRCAQLKYKPCLKAFKAHKIDPETFEVTKPIVEKGESGWDALFTNTSMGDSWYTEEKDEEHSRLVSAPTGTLAFFCLVHTRMQGTIEVED